MSDLSTPGLEDFTHEDLRGLLAILRFIQVRDSAAYFTHSDVSEVLSAWPWLHSYTDDSGNVTYFSLADQNDHGAQVMLALLISATQEQLNP